MRYACSTLLAQAGTLHYFNLEILRDVEVVMSHEEGPMLALAGPSLFFYFFYYRHVQVVMSHEEGQILVLGLSE